MWFDSRSVSVRVGSSFDSVRSAEGEHFATCRRLFPNSFNIVWHTHRWHCHLFWILCVCRVSFPAQLVRCFRCSFVSVPCFAVADTLASMRLGLFFVCCRRTTSLAGFLLSHPSHDGDTAVWCHGASRLHGRSRYMCMWWSRNEHQHLTKTKTNAASKSGVHPINLLDGHIGSPFFVPSNLKSSFNLGTSSFYRHSCDKAGQLSHHDHTWKFV